MAAQSSCVSAHSQASGNTKLLSSPPPTPHNDSPALNLALLKMLEQLLGTEKKADKEMTRRRYLLEKLIRKVQPGFTEAEVRKRAQEILQKGDYKNFDLEHLRELIEGSEEGEGPLGVEGGISSAGGGAGSGAGGGEGDLEEDGEDVWDQLSQLDDESLAALEVEVTAELKKKLADMGIPTGK